MATLPQAADYGGAPSFQTGRLDRPGTADSETANALVNASNVLASVIKERGDKVDKLHYALARNDLMKADLMEREKLDGDQDYATHDKRYSEGYKAARDKIAAHYNLEAHDSAVWSAEADLIGVRGGIAVRGTANDIRVDQGYASLIDGMDEARQLMTMAKDFKSRNAVIDGQLEAINAARADGYITTEEEAEKMRQGMTQKFARASLDAMPADERKAALEATQRKRRNSSDPKVLTATGIGQGPLTADEMRAGGGSDSVADFLHGDEVAKMLEDATEQSKTEIQRVNGYATHDEAMDMFPGSSPAAHAARMKHAKTLTGTERQIAEQKLRATQADFLEEEAAYSKATADVYDRQIQESTMEEPFTFEDIPPEARTAITPARLEDLKRGSDMQQRRQQYAPTAQIANPSDGSMSVEEWNELSNYGKGGKTDQDLDTYLWRSVLDEKTWWALKTEQDELIKAENLNIPVENMKPYIDDFLEGQEIMKTTGRSLVERGKAARLEQRMNKAVAAKQHSFTPTRELTQQEIDTTLMEVISSEGTVRLGVLGIDSLFPDKQKKAFDMTTEELNVAYLTLGDEDPGPTVGGQKLTMKEFLLQEAKSYGYNTPTQRQLERAYFAMESNLGTAEVLRRLASED